MIKGLDHINIVVSDVEKSASFYIEYLDFKKTGEKYIEGKWIEKLTGLQGIKAKVIFLSHDSMDTKIELLQYFSPEGKKTEINSIPNTMGIRHIAFRTDSFDSIVKKLEASMVEFIGEPVDIPNPPDKFKSKICYFYDPDKNILEITGI